uniref:Uncharacterized protein n=1 Tax=viral metagenome TaxID=1070528 RepID=A0A6M3X5M2_9ZZZZ
MASKTLVIGDTITVSDLLKLLLANATSLSFGDATHEGGNLVVYRDSAGNTQFEFDADAASNEKAFKCYGGVVFENNVTIGQVALDLSYLLYIVGNMKATGAISTDASIYTGTASGMNLGTGGIESRNDNQASMNMNISVSGTDSTNHLIEIKIDGTSIIAAQATGNGGGGVTDPKAIIKEKLVYTPSSDTAITAAGGITVTKAIMRIVGDGAAIDITADPQIVAGTDGQIVILQGTSDANTVTLDDGTGLALSAQCVLANQDTITLIYDAGDSEWIETSRTTVV